jgi:hypothetical protein
VECWDGATAAWSVVNEVRQVLGWGAEKKLTRTGRQIIELIRRRGRHQLKRIRPLEKMRRPFGLVFFIKLKRSVKGQVDLCRVPYSNVTRIGRMRKRPGGHKSGYSCRNYRCALADNFKIGHRADRFQVGDVKMQSL